MLVIKQLIFGNEASSCFGSEGEEMLLLCQHATQTRATMQNLWLETGSGRDADRHRQARQAAAAAACDM